jgi:hypothetical protein
MSEGGKDLFGKIDALFEKRATGALVDKGLDYEDFPVLTEVVGTAPAAPSTWGGTDRREESRRRNERRLSHEPEVKKQVTEEGVASGSPGTDLSTTPGTEPEMERIMQIVDQRLSMLFKQQQTSLQDIVRNVVREELAKGK